MTVARLLRAQRLAVVFALCAATAASAQTYSSADYTSLVHRYATGGTGGVVSSVNALAAWPRKSTTSAVQSAYQLLTWHDQLAAAILHTELANAIADHQHPDDVAFHLDCARELMRAARSGGDPAVVDATWRQWYTFVIHMFASLRAIPRALRYAREGLDQFPREPMLYVARGAVNEAIAQQLVTDWRRDTSLEPRVRSQTEQLFKAAVADYQHALDIDGTIGMAYLRIGWTRLFTRDSRAGDALQKALDHADDDRVRYLAHLFLGGAHEQARRLDEARREYESAVAVGGQYQTGYVALSRVEEALGHTEPARELASACAQLAKQDDDPWWDYRVGFDRVTLLRLRAEAQR